MEKMNAAAEEARKEYPKGKLSADVGSWMNKWFMKAGYKRLSIIILQEENIRPTKRFE
jgi:hypothetical protein